MSTVLPMPTLKIGPGGRPSKGHILGVWAAGQELREIVSELPGPIEHLTVPEAEDIASRMVQRYLAVILEQNGL